MFMPLSNQNPLMNNFISSQNSNLNLPGNNVSPQEWEYIQQIRRTGYDQNQVQQQNVANNQSDPYNDFETEFSKCSSTVQNKILNDSDFKQSMFECDKLIQATMESIIRPQVMQTRDGRMAFERLLATFRNIKDRYIKEESDNMERLQKLMQDDVVKQRLAEIEKGLTSSSNQSKGANSK